MTKRTATAIGYAVWAILLVPVVLLMQWLGFAEWSWGGFLTAYAIVAVISITFEIFERWVERRLRRRAEQHGASSAPKQ